MGWNVDVELQDYTLLLENLGSSKMKGIFASFNAQDATKSFDLWYGPLGNGTDLYTFKFQLKEVKTIYYLKVYTFQDLLSSIGGFVASIKGISSAIFLFYGVLAVQIKGVRKSFSIRSRKNKTKFENKNINFSPEMDSLDKKELIAYLKPSNILQGRAVPFLYFFRCISDKCSNRIAKRNKFLASGLKELDKSLDLVTIVKLRKRIKTLEQLFLTKDQLLLSRASNWYFLSESESSNSDMEYPTPWALTTAIANHELKTDLDRQLLKNIFKKGKALNRDSIKCTKPKQTSVLKQSSFQRKEKAGEEQKDQHSSQF